MSVLARARRIINIAAKRCPRCEEITMYSGYAEPGYSDPESGVIALGNWNSITKWNPETRSSYVIDDTPTKVAKLLEKLGVELEWSDEWASCCVCSQLVRTTGNCYQWQRAYSDTDEGAVCLECLDPAKHLEECEERGRGNQIGSIDPAKHGYKLVSENLESGWYGGQKADPDRIAKVLKDAEIDRVLLNLDSVSQFEMSFSVWVHKSAGRKQINKAKKLLANPANTDAKEDPKDVLSRGLKAAAKATAELPAGEGIQYTKVNTDGTATTRIVSPQEFIDGIKD